MDSIAHCAPPEWIDPLWSRLNRHPEERASAAYSIVFLVTGWGGGCCVMSRPVLRDQKAGAAVPEGFPRYRFKRVYA
jgi:hypothetical protein